MAVMHNYALSISNSVTQPSSSLDTQLTALSLDLTTNQVTFYSNFTLNCDILNCQGLLWQVASFVITINGNVSGVALCPIYSGSSSGTFTVTIHGDLLITDKIMITRPVLLLKQMDLLKVMLLI